MLATLSKMPSFPSAGLESSLQGDITAHGRCDNTCHRQSGLRSPEWGGTLVRATLKPNACQETESLEEAQGTQENRDHH